MLTDNGNIVISKTPVTQSEDYEWLRNTGLGYIQQFSGKIWTDYNIHDPGVTILELLCYALTDLAYRTSFPVADLLTDAGEKGPHADDFFTADQILTTCPITLNDYRKLILDRTPGVRNVWLETMDDINYDPAIYFDEKTVDTSLTQPVNHPFEIIKLKGLYIVKIEVEDYQTIADHHQPFLTTLAQFRNKDSAHAEAVVQPDEYKICLENYVKDLLSQNRNLCEDFEVINVPNAELIAVCADIELKPDANADVVFLKIYSALYNYINPNLKFYSFKELIDKQKRTEDIFNGPSATRGFIDEDDLNKHGHLDVLYVSDIINLLMDIPGILQIKKIHLSSYKDNGDGTFSVLQNAQPYCLHLQDTSNSVFQFILDADAQDKTKIFNSINFSKGLIYFTPKRKPEYSTYDFIDYPSSPADFENDLPIPPGTNRDILNYYSIQNDFPLFYYTGMDGIPKGETNLRKAQRLQSKAYLLFFDQLLADYLKQLDQLKNIFTWRGGVTALVLQPLPLSEDIIKDLGMLLQSDGNPPNFGATYTSYAQLIETPDQQKQRRNRLLDHLLARFNELFVDYSVFKFQQNKTGDFFDEATADELIDDKIQFLSVYPEISCGRSRAFNYTKPLYGSGDNVTGLQLRIQKMLGVISSQNKKLSVPTNVVDYKLLLQNIATGVVPAPADKLVITDNRFDDFDANFGIHVLEHILLRPLYKSTAPLNNLLPLCGNGTNNEHAECLIPDNYSMQMTVVAPGWLSISNNMDFRAFTESLIRTEAPAHVTLKICWLDPALMFLFEQTTEAFFTALAKVETAGAVPVAQDITDFNTALLDVYTMMGLLKNMYLPSILDECDDINYNEEADKIKVPVILDYSALGSDGKEEWFVFEKKQP
ncbi:hypothetical protein [Mucilaginibacter sp.]|jgi:hypothetical protein|uniref:hypothetical protein n=1 Tax=Mucilaginibacter sp. TaxID=1882438 RepID=UPI002C65E19C|nr:hypothetical protein [Mucilaginibacter sp.]HTI61056.1 hypothetical protein [Mucilaginibacter sp.]